MSHFNKSAVYSKCLLHADYIRVLAKPASDTKSLGYATVNKKRFIIHDRGITGMIYLKLTEKKHLKI